MRKKLYYFYQLTKRKIRILYITGIIFYICQIAFALLDVIYEKQYFFQSEFGNSTDISLQILLLILYVLSNLSLLIYFSLSTKHIDFILYVRAWMIGYNIYDKFDDMSYLISRSYFYKEKLEEESDDESDDNDLKQLIEENLGTTSIGIRAAEQHFDYTYASTDHQTLLEDVTS